MKVLILLALFLSPPILAGAADMVKGQVIVTQVCGACHNPDGNSSVATFPRLAGQHAEYIVRQLSAFKSGKRVNAMMAPVASALSDTDMQNVAAYFSAQTPKLDTATDPAGVIRGGVLYRGGDKERAVPACMSCHGPAGAGIPVQFPRIGGQHADYVEAQLHAYHDGSRGGDGKDANAAIMHAIALKLTDAEMKDVAQYVTGLHLKQ